MPPSEQTDEQTDEQDVQPIRSVPRTRSANRSVPRARSATRTAPNQRRLRGEQTRQEIAEAVIALLEEGGSIPTARQVAERAGVSLRLVFHHFDDMEAVFEEAAMLQGLRHWRLITDADPSLPLHKRIVHITTQRRRLFEAITPVRRAANARLRSSSTIQDGLALGRARLRAQLTATFAPELERAGDDAVLVLDALDAAGSWEAWESLRAGTQRPPTQSEAVVRRLMAAVLNDL